MARRSDHSREEIKSLAIQAGQNILIDEGLEQFSARKVAKQIGYTVGTLYNIFGDYDDIMTHIHAVTLDDMASYIHAHIDADTQGNASLQQLGASYLNFAKANKNRWTALFEHHPSAEKPIPEWYSAKIQHLFHLVEQPLILILDNDMQKAQKAARILWASIHGICILGLSGKLKMVGCDSMQHMMDDSISIYLRGLQQ